MGCQTSLYDHRRLTGAYKQVGGWHEGNHSARLVKADSGCCPAQTSPFFDSRTSIRQRFEAHRLIEQFATEGFRCIGIFVANVGNDISEVFVSRLKDYYDVHADNYRRARVTVSLTICHAPSTA